LAAKTSFLICERGPEWQRHLKQPAEWFPVLAPSAVGAVVVAEADSGKAWQALERSHY
jgi:hypothetical protein